MTTYLINMTLEICNFSIQTYFRDLTKVNMNEFTSLVFIANLTDVATAGGNNFNLTYRYYVYTIPTPAANPAPTNLQLLTGNSNNLYLASNFVPLPLCNPTNNEKYVSGVVCSPIVSCTKATLNAVYCSNESVPLICSNNFYFDPLTQKCDSKCSGNAPRSPSTVDKNSICNFQCVNNATCPVASVSAISNLQANYLCSPGYNRIGYRCTNINSLNSKL